MIASKNTRNRSRKMIIRARYFDNKHRGTKKTDKNDIMKG